MFQLEVVSDNIARLYLNGEDIRTTLGTVKCSPMTSANSSPKKSVLSSPIKEIEPPIEETREDDEKLPENYETLPENDKKPPENDKEIPVSEDTFVSPINEANIVKEICDRVVEDDQTQVETSTTNISNGNVTKDSELFTPVSSMGEEDPFKSVDMDNDSAIGNQSFISTGAADESVGDVFCSPMYEANLINEICDRIVEMDVKSKIQQDEVKAVMLEEKVIHSEEKKDG